MWRRETVRVTLGRVGAISADTARRMALEAKEQIDAGNNPNIVKRIDAVKTLEEAFELFRNSETSRSEVLVVEL